MQGEKVKPLQLVAVPVFAKALAGGSEVDFGSCWFVAAVASFLLLMVVGLVAQARGTLSLLDPTILYQQFLDWSPWEFKKNLLFFAGEHAHENHELVRRKGIALNFMTGFVIAETAFLVFWIATT